LAKSCYFSKSLIFLEASLDSCFAFILMLRASIEVIVALGMVSYNTPVVVDL